MILKADHPYVKFFSIYIDGEIQRPYLQYDTTLKVAALCKGETAKLLAWDVGRSYKARLVISESYEINPGMFVRDVHADFQLRFSDKCPSNIRDQILE